MSTKKYVCWAGFVVGIPTGREIPPTHFITGPRLAFLYGVPPMECIFCDDRIGHEMTWEGLDFTGMIHLHPTYGGEGYQKLPTDVHPSRCPERVLRLLKSAGKIVNEKES